MSKITDLANKFFRANSRNSADGEPNKVEPIEDINDQSLEETKLVEHVKSKIDLVRQSNSRIAIEGIYLTNVAYLLGFDGVYYDTTYRQFKNIDTKKKLTRNRFKVNKILPTIQNRLARLTQSPPRYDVRPNSNSTEDKDAARLGLDIIGNIFEKQHFDEKRQDVLMSCMQGGHAYIQGVWDPTLGKPMIDPESNSMVGYEGDLRLEVLNCLEVFPDPLGKRLEDCQYIIKAKVRKLDYFKERYPERGDLVKEEGTWLMSSLYDMKSNALTAVGIAGASTNDQAKNSAIELIYYEKRSEDHPNGRMIAIANGVLLEEKELPIGEYDMVKFDDIMVGGRYNSEAVITHLRPVQDQYNITRTKCADWVRKMLAGKYLAAKGAGLNQEAINDSSGEVVEFNPVPNAPPPTPMQVPMIPQYVYKDLETLDKEFDFISGINEISRGVLPSSSIPASGMAFLQEQDQTRIGAQTARNEIAYSKLGCIVLKYVGKFYQLPRVLKIAGDGLEYTVKDFLGSDLRDNYDVIVMPGSTSPTSKVLKRQDIMNMYQSGLMGNPQDPKLQAKVLEMMEFGDTAEVWKEQALDAAQVKRVLHAIETNDEPELKANMDEFDNQSYHLKEMNNYRKTDKFLTLSDQQKNLFKWVMEWRLQALINATNPQLAQETQLAQSGVDAMEKELGPSGSTQAEKAVQEVGNQHAGSLGLPQKNGQPVVPGQPLNPPGPGAPGQLNPSGGGLPPAM